MRENIALRVDSAIKTVIKHFEHNAIIQDVDDWQGKPTTKENNQMLVCRNINFQVFIPSDLELTKKLTGSDQPWAEHHFQERISGIPSNPGETYKYWPYHTNLDNDKRYKDEVFSHTYQERYWPKFKLGDSLPREGIRFQYGDLMEVVNLLKSNPTTRQAYLPIWFPEDTWAANHSERVPCSLGYYFYIEKNNLNCIYTIRSCDIFRHFRNDVYLTLRLVQHIHQRLIEKLPGLELGKLYMNIYNLHQFVNDKYPFTIRERKINL